MKKKQIDYYNFLDKSKNVKNIVNLYLRQTCNIFKYRELPETIPENIMERMLQMYGFVCFTQVQGKFYVFWGGLGGEPDVYYQPTICTVSNPALNFSKDLKIDEDCVIIKNDTFLQGYLPIFTKLASLQVENDISLKMAMTNTRLQAILSAKDNNTLQSARDFLDKLERGENSVIVDNAFLDSLKVAATKTGTTSDIENLITLDLYLRSIFTREIGLPGNANLKKERMITSEIEDNYLSLFPVIDDMLQERQIALEKINKMYGLNISVELSGAWANLQKQAYQEIENPVENSGNPENTENPDESENPDNVENPENEENKENPENKENEEKDEKQDESENDEKEENKEDSEPDEKTEKKNDSEQKEKEEK